MFCCLGEIVIKWSKYVILTLLFITGAIFSLTKIGIYTYDGIQSRKMYSEINNMVNSTRIITETFKSKSDNINTNADTLKIVYDEIIHINPCYAGYIYIANTSIQYPIVQGDDNIFYLTHDILGKTNTRGSIFMDYRNNSGFTDGNTVLYGHNMRDKSMFNQLLNYKDEQFLKNAGTIKILIESEMLEYDVFAAYKIEENEEYLTLNFQDEQDFNQYLDKIKSRTEIDTTYDINCDDRILTLSTCNDAGSSIRYVVHAVLRR